MPRTAPFGQLQQHPQRWARKNPALGEQGPRSAASVSQSYDQSRCMQCIYKAHYSAQTNEVQNKEVSPESTVYP